MANARARARALRKIMTTHEVKLWLRLRRLRPQGLHFRRQVPLSDFIVDFACLKASLIIEIDGEQHGLPAGLARDRWRDSVLQEAGFAVLRFWNHEIDHGLDAVAEAIYQAAAERLTPSVTASPRHLPL